MKKWEYLFINEECSQNRLNDFGNEGWELISVNWTAEQFTYLFKRQKEEKDFKLSKNAKSILND
jgi:hypothetical protein